MSEQLPGDPRDTDADRMVETPETLRDRDPEVMPMDRGVEATDRPLAAEKFGTTRAEEAEGESLDERVAQEVPDTGAGAGASGDARERGDLAAEEAAVHVVDPR